MSGIIFFFGEESNYFWRPRGKVFVYFDDGVDVFSFRQTWVYLKRTLEKFCPGKYSFAKVGHESIADGRWIGDAALLAIPGGADVHYAKHLNGVGNGNIRKFVESGGALLAICAGAYYCSSHVKFAIGTSIEVDGPRELKFFSGVAHGPLFKKYTYGSDRGACAVKISLHSPGGSFDFRSYYNGGCAFLTKYQDFAFEPVDDVEVLGTYSDFHGLPAMIKCRVGLGVALLSGVHFEYRDENFFKSRGPAAVEIWKLLVDGREKWQQLDSLILGSLLK
jgi:biotin--protein ligase